MIVDLQILTYVRGTRNICKSGGEMGRDYITGNIRIFFDNSFDNRFKNVTCMKYIETYSGGKVEGI